MCGIVGYISKTDKTRPLSKEKFFREALFADTLRGADSTGVMSVRSDDFSWAWSKNAVPAYKFIREKSWFERDTDTWCAVGHNRSATVGEVTTDNAHPFQHENVILVHNGTLRSTYSLNKQDHKLKVDSDLLALNLASVPPEEAHTILTEVNGAYALVWFDKRDGSVNIARNSERPFHMGINRAADLIVFASDGHLLNFIASRMGDTNAQPRNIWQLGTGHQLKYKKGVMVPEVTKIAPFVHTSHYGAWPTERYHHSSQTTSGSTISLSVKDSTKTPAGTRGLLGRTVSRPAGKACKLGKTRIVETVRTIPSAFTTMIEDWYHLKHDTEMYFVSQKHQPWSNGFGMVWGQVYHDEWDTWFDAYIPQTTPTSMQLYGSKPWTVVPCAVTHISPHSPKGGCTFICQVVRYEWNGVEIEKECPNEHGTKTPLLDTFRERSSKPGGGLVDSHGIEYDTGYEGDLKGPHGDVSVRAWEKLTQDGCTMCMGPVFRRDHLDITWVGEYSNQPLCLQCLEWSTQIDRECKHGYLKD